MNAWSPEGRRPSDGPGAPRLAQLFSSERKHRAEWETISTSDRTDGRRRKRDLVVCILLIVAGVVLAIALFGAGILWKTKTATKVSDFTTANQRYKAPSLR